MSPILDVTSIARRARGSLSDLLWVKILRRRIIRLRRKKIKEAEIDKRIQIIFDGKDLLRGVGEWVGGGGEGLTIRYRRRRLNTIFAVHITASF